MRHTDRLRSLLAAHRQGQETGPETVSRLLRDLTIAEGEWAATLRELYDADLICEYLTKSRADEYDARLAAIAKLGTAWAAVESLRADLAIARGTAINLRTDLADEIGTHNRTAALVAELNVECLRLRRLADGNDALLAENQALREDVRTLRAAIAARMERRRKPAPQPFFRNSLARIAAFVALLLVASWLAVATAAAVGA